MKCFGVFTLISLERQCNLANMLELQAYQLMGVGVWAYMLVCAAFSMAGCGSVSVSAKTQRLRDAGLEGGTYRSLGDEMKQSPSIRV